MGGRSGSFSPAKTPWGSRGGPGGVLATLAPRLAPLRLPVIWEAIYDGQDHNLLCGPQERPVVVGSCRWSGVSSRTVCHLDGCRCWWRAAPGRSTPPGLKVRNCRISAAPSGAACVDLPDVGARADPGRVGPSGVRDRGVGGVGDPARRRYRTRASSGRADLAAVPGRSSARDHRL